MLDPCWREMPELCWGSMTYKKLEILSVVEGFLALEFASHLSSGFIVVPSPVSSSSSLMSLAFGILSGRRAQLDAFHTISLTISIVVGRKKE